MRVPRLYIDAPLCSGQQLELPQQQSNYLCRVLRFEVGRELWLFNGAGGAYKSVLSAVSPKRAQVIVGERDEDDRESPFKIELGIALSKGDRFDLVVQKATELGAYRIQPLITEHVDIRLSAERAAKKLAHWRAISISASEQSGRNCPPAIDEPLPLSDWCAKLNQGCRILMDPAQGVSIRGLQIEGQSAAVLIGPEGGLSESELDFALNQGFTGVKMGPRVLRTETAPLAVLSVMQAIWGDM